MTSLNDNLTNAILQHILTGLGMYGSVPVSLRHEAFVTERQFAYTDYQDEVQHAPIWSCSTTVSNKVLSIVGTQLNLSNFPSDVVNDTDTFVVVKLDNNPAYGMYLFSEGEFGPSAYHDGFVATELKEGAWIPCSTYLQATFLAGMEQMRDLTAKFEVGDTKNQDKMYKTLMGFIAYRETMCGDAADEFGGQNQN